MLQEALVGYLSEDPQPSGPFVYLAHRQVCGESPRFAYGARGTMRHMTRKNCGWVIAEILGLAALVSGCSASTTSASQRPATLAQSHPSHASSASIASPSPEQSQPVARPDQLAATVTEGDPTSVAAGSPTTSAMPVVDATCVASQLHFLVAAYQPVGGGNGVAPMRIVNPGPTCTLRGFAHVTLADASGSPLPTTFAKTSDTPQIVTVKGGQSDASASQGAGDVYFEIDGTDRTVPAQTDCPALQVETPAKYLITLPGGSSAVTVTAQPPDGRPVSSCNGRIEVGPVTG